MAVKAVAGGIFRRAALAARAHIAAYIGFRFFDGLPVGLSVFHKNKNVRPSPWNDIEF